MQKDYLTRLYNIRKQSVAQIATKSDCSQGKINYWLAKHQIKKRTISEAIYNLKNPEGDPFKLQNPQSLEEGILYGLGIGLYWGEGLKRGKGGMRLGNTDARLLHKFIIFLDRFFKIKKSELKFGLQIFNDINPEVALSYWVKELDLKKSQFYKITVSKVRGEGTYIYRSEYGVITIYFNNTKLKELICKLIDKV